MNGESLHAAVAHLQNLKQEHRPLVVQIAEDTGMSPITRRQLLEHLLAEEDEAVAAAAAALGAPGEGGISARRLTVGSLRADAAVPAASRGTVGSLREGGR